MAYLGTTPNTGENRKLDDISGSFNGSTTTFDLQVDSSDIYPGAATALLISVGGVIQEPKTAYSLHSNGKQITFATAPSAGEDFFGLVLGQAIDVATPADDSVTTAKIADRAVTQAKLAESSVGGSKVRANVLSSGSIYTANIAGNAYVTRGFAVGYTDGRVPQANLDVKGNVYISGDTSIPDSSKIRFGADEDFELYHDGSNSYMDNKTGGIYVRTASTKNAIVMEANAGIRLYYNGSQTLNTVSGGTTITGKLSAITQTPAFYGANVTGNASVTRSLAVGFTDGRVPQANLEVKGNTYISGITTFGSAAIGSTLTDATNTGGVTLDFDTYQNFVLTFTGNVTLDNPTTESVGQSGIIVCIQDGSGSRTLSLGTDYETAGGSGITLSTAASAVDVIPYFVKAAASIQLGAVQKAFS